MSDERRRLTLLERLDVALATRVALRREGVDLGRPEDLRPEPQPLDLEDDARWVTSVLGLRGFQLRSEEAAAAIRSESTPPAGSTQEARLVFGMAGVLRAIRARAAEGTPPDGWHAVAMFRRLTADIARFRANAIRRDEPWDGVFGVQYSGADALPAMLENFCEAKSYGEKPDTFMRMHPVRRSVRMMWAFQRIAPFPDFNTVMAFVLMNGYLLAKGYPIVTPQPGDKHLLAQLARGPRPQRVVQFESRLVAAAETQRAPP